MIQEDVPIGGLDLEEEEHVAPTDAESQKKQLKRSNRIKALQKGNKTTFALNGGSRAEIGRFRKRFLLEVLILKKKNMQLPQTLRVRRSNLDVPTSNRIKALQRGNKITFALNGGVRAKIG